MVNAAAVKEKRISATKHLERTNSNRYSWLCRVTFKFTTTVVLASKLATLPLADAQYTPSCRGSWIINSLILRLLLKAGEEPGNEATKCTRRTQSEYTE